MTKAQTRRRSKGRPWIEKFLLLAGIIALGVWVWSVASNVVFQDWESWVFDRKILGEQSTISEYAAERSRSIAAGVRAWLGFPATPEPAVSSRPNIGPSPVRPTPQDQDRDGLVGRLTIPRLHLSAMVREGADETTLALALGHIPGTALPGRNGNVGVAGHRDTLFRDLRKINKNDLIRLETFAGDFAYRVETTEIVRPQNVNVLNAREYPELTLVTCYPFYYVGSAPQRFIVKARQVLPSQTEPEPTEAPQETERQTVEPNPVERKPGTTRVFFELSKNHSRQLSNGISLGLTGVEEASSRVNGWLWVMPDRRTIWLRGQKAREPVVFYGHLDGKRRELVITSVTRDSVTGYLIAPEVPSG